MSTNRENMDVRIAYLKDATDQLLMFKGNIFMNTSEKDSFHLYSKAGEIIDMIHDLKVAVLTHHQNGETN